VERSQFSKGPFVLDYLSFGSGPKTLICFHGFGRRAEDFLYFRKELESTYTVYSFFFFHHGRSEYPGDRIDKNTLRAEEWNELIRDFLNEKKIDRFSLMGYSMGGKLALSILERQSAHVDEIFLMAPDGIKTNFWYRFTSKNKLGNMIYRRVLKNPKPLFSLMNLMVKLRLVSSKLVRFAQSNLETREKRELVYKVWLTLRHVEPTVKTCSRIIAHQSIQCYLLFGKYDNVILPSTGIWFQKLSEGKAKFFEVECGHNMYNENSKAVLKKILS